jgi:hypothetical protein
MTWFELAIVAFVAFVVLWMGVLLIAECGWLALNAMP